MSKQGVVRVVGWLVFVAGFGISSVRAADSKPKVASIDDFMKCVDQERWPPDECIDALQKHVKGHPAQAFEAGRAVTMKMNHWSAIPFFEKALSGKFDRARCGDERLALAVTSAFALADEKKDNKVVAAAGNISAKCWDELRPAVLKELESNAGGYTADNVCPLFAERKVVSPACTKKVAVEQAPAPTRKWEPLDPRKIDVEGPAKVYRGDEGRRVTLVKVKDRPGFYLIKFDGFRGPWNGRVLLHRESDAGTGYDYWTQQGSSLWVSVVARKEGSSFFQYEVYPTGDKGPFPVFYDETASKAANPKVVLSEFVK